MISLVEKPAINNGLVLVTVTYGDRIRLLSQLLDRALGEEGVPRALVVNNAASSDFSQLKAKWGHRIVIVELPFNTGSARGYAVGIQAALALGAEYLWLMDDDNAPAKGTVRVLIQELGHLSDEIGIARAAVLGFRKSRTKALNDPSKNYPPRSSFVGFHVLQIPQKLLSRLVRASVGADVTNEIVDVPYSPYGGFLAHRETFKCLGVPRSDLVLYADDWEYTMRLTRCGGKIRLIPRAGIEDLEPSWNHKRKQSNIFVQSLVFGSDFQIYYTFRNHVWLNRNVQCASDILYKVNKFVFLSLLSVFALTLRKGRRLSLIRCAISDGERGSLGINPNYPLPV